MIKGCQKKIIVVEGSEKSPFETAFFLLRRDIDPGSLGGENIMREADRIISRGLPAVRRRSRRRERFLKIFFPVLCFFTGLLLGFSLCLLAAFFLQ